MVVLGLVIRRLIVGDRDVYFSNTLYIASTRTFHAYSSFTAARQDSPPRRGGADGEWLHTVVYTIHFLVNVAFSILVWMLAPRGGAGGTALDDDNV